MPLASLLVHLSSPVNNTDSLSCNQLMAHPCFKYFSGSCYLWHEVQTPWHGDKARQHPICPTAFYPQCCGPAPVMPNCLTLYLPWFCAFAPASFPLQCLLRLLDGILRTFGISAEAVSPTRPSRSLLEVERLFSGSPQSCLFTLLLCCLVTLLYSTRLSGVPLGIL